MQDALASPEQELLLLCARPRLEGDQEERIRALAAAPLNWPSFLATAGRNAVLPLLYPHLSRLCWNALPGPCAESLRTFHQNNQLRGLRLTAELIRVIELLHANQIPAIPYKGPALAASLYGDVALREYWDLDILVRPEDMVRVKQVLLAAGYLPGISLGPAQEKSLLRFGCERHFCSPDGQSILEVHWRITAKNHSLDFGPTGLWTGLQPISLSGSSLPQFSAENYLLVLCVHGGKHAWKCLSWVCDVAEMLRKHRDLDWELMFERARSVGAERLLALGLHLAENLLGATACPDLRSRVQRDPAIQSLAAEARESMLRHDAPATRPLELFWFFLRSRERWADRLRCALRVVLMPELSDWQAVNLPSGAHGLYPLVRVVRLLGKYSLGRMRGTPRRNLPASGAETFRNE
ncbi:MAG: nucleotidyltransferase domain-containing protein [Terriglobales bacterium]